MRVRAVFTAFWIAGSALVGPAIAAQTPEQEPLAKRGYDKLMGARPMARLIQEKVKQPLAEELLFGKLAAGGEVHVSVKADELAFELTPAPPKASKRKPKKAAVAKKTSATPAEESKGDEQD